MSVYLADVFLNRAFEIAKHKQPRLLTLSIPLESQGDSAAMTQYGWAPFGRPKRWTKVVTLPEGFQPDVWEHIVEKSSSQVRSVKTPDNQDAGWRVKLTL